MTKQFWINLPVKDTNKILSCSADIYPRKGISLKSVFRMRKHSDDVYRREQLSARLFQMLNLLHIDSHGL